MNKPATLQNSLMLAPLIGATDLFITAAGLCLMFITVIGTYGLLMSVLRSRLMPCTRLLAGALLATALTSCAEIVARAWSLEWHQHAGIYAGLIALQCVVLEHNGFFQRPRLDRLRLCCVFVALMLGLGLLRETLGNGGLHLATLAPGGFILLGLLIAARQAWTRSTPSP
ncbi:Rnf-Nqr domain containing protein [Pseudomonas sp. NPDC086278]|uniref:Rnf-Nqr domain containing protein n=1 Tax=Pseudomonas sp. NPDC086278 TaxID=3390646 RepID=UPI003CFED3DC